MENTIIYMENSVSCTSLGSVQKRIARESLREVINSRKLDINQIKLVPLNINLEKTEIGDRLNVYTFKIDFDLKNQEDKPFILKINKHNYQLYANVNGRNTLIFRNLKNDNYYVLYEHLVSLKDRPNRDIQPNDKVDIDFTASYNEAKFSKTFTLDLYNKKILEKDIGYTSDKNNIAKIKPKEGFFQRFFNWFKNIFG